MDVGHIPLRMRFLKRDTDHEVPDGRGPHSIADEIPKERHTQTMRFQMDVGHIPLRMRFLKRDTHRP